MHKTKYFAVKCVQSVWAALLFGIKSFPEILYFQMADREKFRPIYKVLIFYFYKTNVHILPKLHDTFFSYPMCTQNFKKTIKMRTFVIRWCVRINIFALENSKYISDKCCRENRNTYLRSVTFLQNSWNLWDNVEKYCRTGQAANGNMAHVHCTLSN
jgi:hypothetical protein